MPRLRRIATCKPFTTARISGWEPSLAWRARFGCKGLPTGQYARHKLVSTRPVKVGHANSVCLALADGASLIAILADNRADAERFGAMLIEHAEKHSLGVWRTYGLAVQGRINIESDAAPDGVARLRSALTDLRDTPLDIRFQLYLVWLAEALGKAGQAIAGLSAIDEALERAELYRGTLVFARTLAPPGELLLQAGPPDGFSGANECFVQSRQWAQEQNALSWELRSATSQARLWRDQGRREEARVLLTSVYDRFTEGFATGDLKTARALLENLT